MGRHEILSRQADSGGASPRLRRTRPRSFIEWKTLRRWGKLPPWEADSAGYLLRLAREEADFTQENLAQLLRCSQQAVAQAERWSSNPTVDFLRRWAKECGATVQLRLMPRASPPASPLRNGSED
jgi:DNA-binding XRE family transcriptional regulator